MFIEMDGEFAVYEIHDDDINPDAPVPSGV